MKFSQQVQVLGMKASKGEYEGTAYDSTKAFVVLDMDKSKGMAVGFSAEAFTIGKSDVFDGWKSLKFPLMAEGEFELTSTGKDSKLSLLGLRQISLKA